MRAPLFFGRELVQQLRPFFFDHLAEIAGNFREIVSFKQELVQALKIFLHHNVIGDYPGGEDPLRSRIDAPAALLKSLPPNRSRKASA